MIRSSSSASSTALHRLFGCALVASRTSMPDFSKFDSPLAPRQRRTASSQRMREPFDPYLNYSRFCDALTLRVHGHPQFRGSCPLFTAKKAFEPHLNSSRSRDALTLRVHGHPQFLDSWPLFTAKKAFEPHSNYSRSRDARRILSRVRSRRSSPCTLLSTFLVLPSTNYAGIGPFCYEFAWSLPEKTLYARLHSPIQVLAFAEEVDQENARPRSMHCCIIPFQSARSWPEYLITHRVTTRNQASSTGNYVRKDLDH